MPGRRETATERSLRLALASNALTLKADTSLINTVMRTMPSSVPHLKKCLVLLGFIDRLDQVLQPVADAGIPAAVREQKLDGQTGPGLKKCLCALTDQVPKGNISLARCGVEFLLFMLEQCEPRAFSKSSVRALLRPKQRKIAKGTLLELAEFTFDCDADATWKVGTSVGDLLEVLAAANRAAGRRGRDLTLPPNWDAHGVYECKLGDGEIVVRNRYTGAEGFVSLSEFECVGARTPGDLIMSKNWSTMQAGLGIVGSMHVVKCCTIAPVVRPGSLQALALEDGLCSQRRDSAAFRTPPAKRPRLPGLRTCMDSDVEELPPFTPTMSQAEPSASTSPRSFEPPLIAQLHVQASLAAAALVAPDFSCAAAPDEQTGQLQQEERDFAPSL